MTPSDFLRVDHQPVAVRRLDDLGWFELRPGAQLSELARTLAELPGLRFEQVMGTGGWLVHGPVAQLQASVRSTALGRLRAAYAGPDGLPFALTDEVLVCFAATMTARSRRQCLARVRSQVLDERTATWRVRVMDPEPEAALALAQDLSRQPGVLWAEPNALQAAARLPEAVTPDDFARVTGAHWRDAWRVGRGLPSIKVMSLDTEPGCQQADLLYELAHEWGVGARGDHAEDLDEHGLNLARLIAQLAPGCPSLLRCVVGPLTWLDWANHFTWAASQGAVVCFASSLTPSNVVAAAVRRAAQLGRDGRGVVFACSADHIGRAGLAFPASLRETIAVGSLAQANGQGSSGGRPLAPDFVAPGGSTVATALAAGASALVLSADPTLQASEVKAILQETARQVEPERARYTAANGQVGPKIEAHGFSPGWTAAGCYNVGERPFLFLLKEKLPATDGNYLHIHGMAPDGTIDRRVKNFRFEPGWNIASTFEAEGRPYLFCLRTHGTQADGSNARIFSFNGDGTLGEVVASYVWPQGWSSVVFYSTGQRTFLILLRAAGIDAPGGKVHIHAMRPDGTVGPLTGAYDWSEGWTAMAICAAGSERFLAALRSGDPDGHGHRLALWRLAPDGTLGEQTAGYPLTAGWTNLAACTLSGEGFLLLLKTRGFEPDGHNACIYALQVGGRLGQQLACHRWREGITTAFYYTVGARSYLFLLPDGVTVQSAPTETLASAQYEIIHGWSPTHGYGQLDVARATTAAEARHAAITRIFQLYRRGQLLRPTDSRTWRSGLSVVDVYSTGYRNCLLLLNGYTGKALVHRLLLNGRVGPEIAEYNLGPGWTSAEFYGNEVYRRLLLLRAYSTGSASPTAEIRPVHPNGTLGGPVAHYTWPTGWTTARIFEVAGRSYLFLHMAQGSAPDGNNVHLYALEPDGTIGSQTAGYRWIESPTQAHFYMQDGKTYLCVLQAIGIGRDSANAHFYEVRPDGTLGANTSNYRWPEEWTSLVLFGTAAAQYLLLLKARGVASDGNNVHLFKLAPGGVLGPQVGSFLAPSGMSDARVLKSRTRTFVLFFQPGQRRQ